MAKIPEFRVSVTIDAIAPTGGHIRTVIIIAAHSIDDAGRRVVAALKLIDEAKEDPNDGSPDTD